MKSIISYIKKEWKFVVVICLAFIISTVQLPYQVYGPGGKIDLNDRFDGEQYETSGSFNITYISSYPGTLPILGLSYIIPNWDIVKNDDQKYPQETIDDAFKREKIQNDVALSNATYIAYTKANKELKIKDSIKYITYIHENAKTDLRIGDIILKVDDLDFDNVKAISEYISKKNENDEVKFKVKRDEKEIACYGKISIIDDLKVIGIGFSNVYEYDENVELKYKAKRNEFGPSGGLMMALYMYNSLTEEDISNGKDIYGTGTIEDGGIVGEIDGVKYKMLGAYKKGARIFIVPSGNYEEAKKVKEDNKLDINIISVESFNDALNKLKELK